MQYLYGKVDTKMNEVFETVAEVLEELRSESGEREYFDTWNIAMIFNLFNIS